MAGRLCRSGSGRGEVFAGVPIQEHIIANALLLNGEFLQGRYCGSLPPDSDEEYVKYRIKIWTVVGRKKI